MTDLRTQMRNLVASYEAEREENAEREHQSTVRFAEQLARERADHVEREKDLIDIIRELRNALRIAAPHAEERVNVPLRTVVARATDLLVQRGEETWND